MNYYSLMVAMELFAVLKPDVSHTFHLSPVKIFALDMLRLVKLRESDKKLSFVLFTFEVEIFQHFLSSLSLSSIQNSFFFGVVNTG